MGGYFRHWPIPPDPVQGNCRGRCPRRPVCNKYPLCYGYSRNPIMSLVGAIHESPAEKRAKMMRRCLSAVGRGLAPAVERNALSVPSMCHPERSECGVEPQAKRRGGCRVSGRRDLSLDYSCPYLDPTFAVPARYPFGVRLRACRPPLRMTHGRYPFVTPYRGRFVNRPYDGMG